MDLPQTPSDQVDAAASIPHKKPTGGNVREQMRQWRERNPEQAAVVTSARARDRQFRAVASKFSALLGPAHIERAAEVVLEAMEATSPVVTGEGPGMSSVETYVPDHRSRLKAAEMVAHFTEGMPVARQINVSATWADFDSERRAVIMGLDSIREAMEDVLLEEAIGG